MTYQSELIKEIVEARGHEKSSLHYESECIESWIEENKGAYPKLCDYQSEWLNYINENIGIGDFPYVTLTDVTDATINNSVPFAYKSAILSGQTLVNVIDEISFPIDANYYFCVDLKQYEINKEYLLVFFNTPIEITEIYIGNASATIVWKDYTTDFIRNGSTVSLKVACPSNYDGDTIFPHFRFGSSQPSLDEVKQMKAMLIPYQQGMENWNIPYFEGMQSVKMPVLTTTGKNLANQLLPLDSTGTSVTSTKIENSSKVLSSLIKICPNQRIVISKNNAGSRFRCFFFDRYPVVGETTSINGLYADGGTTMKITSPVNSEYLLVVWCNDKNTECPINYQVEYGAEKTDWVPYKSNILTVNEDVSLRGIGNVKDTLDCLTGEVVQNIGEIILDGSDDENIIQRDDIQLTDKIAFQINNLFGFNAYYEVPMVCDKFKVYYAQADEELIRPINGSDMIVINISTSKCNDLDSFKVWLSQNPVTVQYQLETESIKTVDLLVQDQNGNIINKIKPIEGTMHLSTSSDTIKPLFSGEIPVEATTQNLASFIDLEMEE